MWLVMTTQASERKIAEAVADATGASAWHPNSEELIDRILEELRKHYGWSLDKRRES